MRKIIAVAAVLTMTSVNAEELKFGDVNYFLKEGQLNATVNVNSTYSKVTSSDTTYETRGVVTDTAFTYAFSDKLNAFVGLSYAYDLETKDQTTTTNADYSSDGLANPALGVNYRLFNQNEARYNFDLGAIARINIQDAEAGSSSGQDSNDGNFAEGRSSLELNARIGRKWNEANEWQLAGGMLYHKDGEATLNATSGDVDVDEDASVDIFTKAIYQYRPVNEFMVLLSAQATRVGDADGKIHGTGNYKTSSHVDFDWGFTAKYLITDNFIAKFNYVVSRNSDVNGKVAGANVDQDKRRENFFGLGVDFLF